MSPPRRWVILLLLVLPLFLSMTDEHGESNGSSSGEFIGKVINFTILFGGLFLLLRKPILKFFGGLSKQVENLIRTAEDSKRKAQVDLDRVNTRLVSLGDEVDEIKGAAKKEGEEEKSRLLQAAKKEAERITSLAEQEIHLLTRMGIQEVKDYAAELACAQALEMIKSRITPEDQFRLIDKSIERLSEFHEKPSSD